MTSYLQFRLDSQLFALPLSVVAEILSLPELTCIPDAPKDVLGVINWRGKTLPVIHLAKRLGISQPKCYITDNLVVINYDNLIVGVVVNQVQDTIEIDEGQIDRVFQQFQPPISLFLEGTFATDDTLVSLINPAHIVRCPEAVSQLLELDVEAMPITNLADFYRQFVGDVSPKERAIFHQRRLDLSIAHTQVADTPTVPFALVEAEQQTIGIPLDQIQEFITIQDIVPIPFSPKFVIGNTTLRGEILCLVDVSMLLGLSSSCKPERQAVVVQWEQHKIAIAIKQVITIANVDRDTLNSLDVSGHQKERNKSGIMGTTLVGDRPTMLLDLKKTVCNAFVEKLEVV